MQTPGQRIKDERDSKGWSQQKLADEISKIKGETISRAAVAKWEAGSSKSQKPDNFFAAAKALGLNPYWVLDESGEKYLLPSPNTQTTSIAAQSNAEDGPALGALQKVPVVGMAQLGDNGFWAELETPVGFGDGHIPFPAKSENAYALRCRGDSMKPRIKNGEFVIVDPSLTPAPGDEVLVKASDGRVMVKELLYVRDDVVHLMSVNEAHGKLAIPLAEIECMHGIAGFMPPHTWKKD